VSATPFRSQSDIGATAGVNVQTNGVTIQSAGSATSGVAANTGGTISTLNTLFALTLATTGAHFFAGGEGSLNIGSGCTVTGLAACLFKANGGSITIAGSLTLNRNPTFSGTTAFATTTGNILVGNSATISGSATGER